jgi:tripartite-type tricarboxylate transporter receptor subunit TctC
VRVILPFGAGGVADLTMRLLGQKLGEKWGQQVVIENRPGAGGTLAYQQLLATPPNGYAMSVTGNASAIAMSILKNPPYDALADFTHISVVASFELLLATRRDAPFTTVAGLIEYSKNNPGKLNLGAINPGSTLNLSAHLFKMMTGIDAQIVTYRTTPDMITAILRGDVDLGFDYYAAFKGPLSDNQIRIIAVAGEQRNPLLPGVPTAEESGLPKFVVITWNALSAPAGLPEDILKRLNRDVNVALTDATLQEKAGPFGMTLKGSTPEAMRARMANDIKRWAEVIEKAGIPKQ